MQHPHIQQWEVLNDPIIYRACRYHSHPMGNICMLGRACKFAHFSALHRPSLTQLLTTVLQLLLPPPATLQAAATTTTLNANAQPFWPSAQP